MTDSSVHSRLSTWQASPSLVIRSRAGQAGSPSMVSAYSSPPAPSPMSSRPPLRWSTVTAILARIAGCRYRFEVTMVPTRTRRVASAIAARMVQASKMSPSRTRPSGIR